MMENEREPKRNTCSLSEKINKYDKFSVGFGFRIDKDKDRLTSMMGTFCSLLLLVCMLTYSGYKFDRVANRKSVDIISTV